MIKRVNSENELDLPESGVEAQKIRALLKCYNTDHDFCRFYRSESLIITLFYDDAVICETNKNGIDIEELCEFVNFCGTSRIFCSEKLGKILCEKLSLNCKILNLMRFSGALNESCAEIKELSLSEAYEILKTAFDIEYEPWYLEMSHRTRHGISRFYGNESSVLCVQHDLCGEALLSQIATLPDKRRQGSASELIMSVCKRLTDVFLLCENELLGFYERIGFERCGIKYELYK